MTTIQQRPEYDAAIEELRRLAREPFETPPALLRLRHRIANERARSHQQMLERVAQAARVDLQPILDDARRRRTVKRRYVTQTLRPLEAQAAERAKAEKEHFHQIRSSYREFSHQLAAAQPPELKFRLPIAWSADPRPGDCGYIIGGTDPDAGTYEASADIVNNGEAGVWLHPHIFGDSGDCDDARDGQTLQDLTYQMGPPETSFAVSSIRVDLIGNGVASSVLGDFKWPNEANPFYQHSFVQMDVYIAQQVGGAWHQWPLLSDQLFVGNGDYVKQIRSVLSGQTYPASIIIRRPEAGGGDLLCHFQLVCRAKPIGSDGRVRIDYRAPDHGVFVGGVALLGNFV